MMTAERQRKTEAAVPIEAKTLKAQLEKELSEKRQVLEQLENESPQSYESLKKQSESAEKLLFEMGTLETRLDGLTSEIELLAVEEKSDVRASILGKAETLAGEKKSLLKRIEQIDMEGQKLQTQFEEHVPKKRIQTESKQLLKWERTIKQPHVAFNIHGKLMTGEETSHSETTVSDAMPQRVRAMQAAGWTLCPGQEIVKEEVLTQANSREFPMIALPTVFGDFV